MAIREGAWDCPSCGRKGNRGPVKFCGGCGSPRGADVKFYLPDDAPEVTDSEALRRARAGPDWICNYCGADNPADNVFCSGCGASRDGTKRRPVVEHPLATPPSASPKPKKRGWCGVGCLSLLALFGFFLYLGMPKEAELTARGFHWTRTINVEELRPVVEQAWQGEVPSGARVLGSSSAVHHVNHIQIGSRTRTRTVSERVQTGTRRVKTGTRDRGNGYFEDVYRDEPVYENRSHEESYEEPIYRDEPVYRQRIRYEIEKWVPSREAKVEGNARFPLWPDPRLGNKEREGGRQETYDVFFIDKEGKTVHYKAPNEQVWTSFEPDHTYTAKVRDGEVVEMVPATSAPR